MATEHRAPPTFRLTTTAARPRDLVRATFGGCIAGLALREAEATYYGTARPRTT